MDNNKPDEPADDNGRSRLVQAIAEFQHRNESIHRHTLGGPSCSYCDIAGRNAVRTLLANRDLALAVLGGAS